MYDDAFDVQIPLTLNGNLSHSLILQTVLSGSGVVETSDSCSRAAYLVLVFKVDEEDAESSSVPHDLDLVVHVDEFIHGHGAQALPVLFCHVLHGPSSDFGAVIAPIPLLALVMKDISFTTSQLLNTVRGSL